MPSSPVRSRVAALPLLAATWVAIGLLGVGAKAQATEVTGNLALTSDYVFRGITQTEGDPAVQLGGKVALASGVYGSLWASNVQFPDDSGARSEIDYVVGYARTLNDDWAIDVSVAYYQYPGTRVDLDYPELIGTLTYRSAYWLMLGYSPDVFATGETGTYAQVGATYPVGDAVRIEAAVGHYDLDDAYGASYAHAQLGAIWAFKAPFELRVTAHDTDRNADMLFPGLAGDRVEVALQASF